MTGIYKLSVDAKTDLKTIHKYGFFEFGEARADKYYAALFERFEQLAQQPRLYQAVDYIRAGYRCSVCGTHSIYYRITDSGIEIMGILRAQSLEHLKS